MTKRTKLIIILTILISLFLTTKVNAKVEGDWEYTTPAVKSIYEHTPFAGTAFIEKYLGNDKNVVVPSTIGGKKVTMISSLESSTFSNNKNIESITIPEGVLSIRGTAFENLPNLTTVILPSSIKEYNSNISVNCPKLKLNLPKLKLMGDGSYRDVEEISITTTYDYDAAWECFNSTNEFRILQGKEPLKWNYELAEIAMKRAAELAYHFEHIRPNGQNSETIMWNVAGGENIFYSSGLATGHTMFAGWRDSPGHRAQMLKDYHVSIGIGCVRLNGATFAVQIFSSKIPDSESHKTGTKEATDIIQVSELYDTVDMKVVGLDSENEVNVGDNISATEVILYNKSYIYSVYTHITIKPSEIKWRSSNENVFTVDASGIVTAKNPGTATLTARLAGQEQTFTIKVKEKINPTAIYFDIPEKDLIITETEDDYSIKLPLNINDTYKLIVKTVPSNATIENITWSSLKPEVASVDSNGVITAHSPGYARIKADIGNSISTEIKIQVLAPTIPVSSISIIGTTILEETETYQLIAIINPSNATSKEVTWKSSNPSVVSVNSTGLVTAVSVGTATISVTSNNGKKAEIKITVTKKTPSKILKGDLNNNGEIDLTDVLIELKIYFKNLVATDYQSEVGDMNDKDGITLTDVLMLLKAYFNK